jgi:peptide chain release factor 1
MQELIYRKIKELEKRFKELEEKLTHQDIATNQNLYLGYVREKSKLEPIITIWQKYHDYLKQLSEVKVMLENEKDEDLKELYYEEEKNLSDKIEKIEKDLEKKFLDIVIPEDDYKNVIVEIRAGTGGLEASLFASDLYKMYSKFAQKKRWRLETIDVHPTSVGGFKEIVFSLSGDGTYRYLKYESGVHRVQRVPKTETGGRIHTSAVSVVVLPEPKEVEVEIDPKDLKIDTFRASGPGGQYVNVTDSAVRITHLPSGIVVSCQDERSQLKNRQKAMRVLKARLLDLKMRQQQKEISEKRKKSIGSGDRSEKIRTYNFPERRVTDHRINLTIYKLAEILEGDMDEILEALILEDRKLALESLKSEEN